MGQLQTLVDGVSWMPEGGQVAAFETMLRGFSPDAGKFYDQLGETQQDMLSTMLLKDKDFAASIETAIAAVAQGGKNPLDGVDKAVLNTVIEEAYNDPEFRKKLIAGMTSTEALLAAIEAEKTADAAFKNKFNVVATNPPVTADAAVTPPATDANADFMNKIGSTLRSFLTSMGPLGNMLVAIFEFFMGKSLNDLGKSTELVTQSAGVNNDGKMVQALADPAATVTVVDNKTGAETPVLVSDLGLKPEEMAPATYNRQVVAPSALA